MKNILVILLHGYQKLISPLLPKSCRYFPTCSQYMLEAIKIHGTFKGFLMGILRVLRCHPFAKGGIDYVPKHFSFRKNKN